MRPRVSREVERLANLELAKDVRAGDGAERATILDDRQSSGFASQDRARLDAVHDYSARARLPLNHWDLSGNWTVAEHAAVVNEAGCRLAFQFRARDVNLVMGPTARGASIPFRVFLDGELVDEDAGTDVGSDGAGTAAAQRCYQLIRQRGPIHERRFEIEFQDAGVEAYCFTFG